jgi:hypothetical protein
MLITKNLKAMPGGLLMDYSGFSTEDLIRMIKEASDEVLIRKLPTDYEDEELRGGIRPHRPNPNG